MMDILIVAAHPDDEILGCGGTIARHAAEGDRVHIVILAEGVTSRTGANAAAELKALHAAAHEAARFVGAEAPRLMKFPDNRMDSVDRLDIIKAIEAVIADVGPETVYTHHGGDLNIDHRITHESVLTACRPVPGSTVRRIYAFETVSSTEWASPSIGGNFRPTRFVDISAHREAKSKALGAYQTEMRPFPHARSVENIEALARVRGATVGVQAAEAFEVIREIVG